MNFRQNPELEPYNARKSKENLATKQRKPRKSLASCSTAPDHSAAEENDPEDAQNEHLADWEFAEPDLDEEPTFVPVLEPGDCIENMTVPEDYVMVDVSEDEFVARLLMPSGVADLSLL